MQSSFTVVEIKVQSPVIFILYKKIIIKKILKSCGSINHDVGQDV